MATGNEYRKVRALLAKTVAAGCTEGEAVSSLETALKLIAKYDLDQSRLEITVPEGWAIKDGKVVKAEPAPKAPCSKDGAATKRTRKPAEPKAKGPTRKAQIIEMLRSPGGTTIDAITARFNILPHTARACISVFGREIGGVSYDRKTKVYRAVA